MNIGTYSTDGGRDPFYRGPVLVFKGERPHLDLSPVEPDATATIGVIDTGIVLSGEKPPTWAADRIICDPGDADVIGAGDAADPAGLGGHGTFVCGLILRADPDAVIRMKGVIDDTSPGPEEDERVAEAITALGAEVDLINLSFGGRPGESAPKPIVDAINGLPARVVVVAAAGNGGTSQRVLPASMKPAQALMVSVGAADESGDGVLVADFSNVWRDLSVFAGGVNVKGPDASGGVSARSGTSFAAAQVTGRIARTARERGVSMLEAARTLLREPDSHIPVWTVNGEHRTPYLRTAAEVVPRAEQGW